MTINPIKTEQDYESTLDRIDELMGCAVDTPEADELDILVTLVETYEAKPDPIEEYKDKVKPVHTWFYPEEVMPEDQEVVIVEFTGEWDGSHGGIRDLYAYKGEWINKPEDVKITRWMRYR